MAKCGPGTQSTEKIFSVALVHKLFVILTSGAVAVIGASGLSLSDGV